MIVGVERMFDPALEPSADTIAPKRVLPLLKLPTPRVNPPGRAPAAFVAFPDVALRMLPNTPPKFDEAAYPF